MRSMLRGEKKQESAIEEGSHLCGVAAAIVGSAVVGGLVSSNSSSKASKAQERASNDATARQDAQYQQTRTDQLAQLAQTRADQAPYREAGVNALNQLTQGSQPGGQFTKTYERTPFEQDPGYQFRLEQGEQGINRAAAARGGQYSGATLKALSRFNSNLASQEYGNYDTRQNRAFEQFGSNRDFQRNNLATQANIGQTATTMTSNAGQTANNAIATAGMNSVNQIGQSIQNAGEARASGYVGTGNAIGSGIRQAYNGFQQERSLQGGSGYDAFMNNANSNGFGPAFTNMSDPAYG